MPRTTRAKKLEEFQKIQEARAGAMDALATAVLALKNSPDDTDRVEEAQKILRAVILDHAVGKIDVRDASRKGRGLRPAEMQRALNLTLNLTMNEHIDSHPEPMRSKLRKALLTVLSDAQSEEPPAADLVDIYATQE